MRARCGATWTRSVPVVRARPSSVGEGLQVLVFSPDCPDLFARICGYFDSAGFSIQDAKIHTTRAGFALDTFQVISTRIEAGDPSAYRDLISLVETQAVLALSSSGPLPEPGRGRVSRRVRSFPVTPRVTLNPDERAQRWLLSVAPATAPACSTALPACWRATRSTCIWPRSARSASASTGAAGGRLRLLLRHAEAAQRAALVFVENHRVVGLDPADPIRTYPHGKVSGGARQRPRARRAH